MLDLRALIVTKDLVLSFMPKSLPKAPRKGELLRIGRKLITLGRNSISQNGPNFILRPRLFVNDPWELIAEAIARKVPDGQQRDIAHSFRRQAEDYFGVATTSHELAVKPVLLYYAFLNLSKSYAMVRGNMSVASRAYHGLSTAVKVGTIPGALIQYDIRHRPAVFQELMSLLGAASSVAMTQPMRLGSLIPQILPGHRLWCYATNKPERFLSISASELLHSPSTKEVWLRLYIDRNDVDQFGVSDDVARLRAGLTDFESVNALNTSHLAFEAVRPTSYVATPLEAVATISTTTKNRIWETVRVGTPYRKQYIYLCPPKEQLARLPQLSSVYMLMFFLSSVTRYAPGYFEALMDSKYGPLIATFISESPVQFLYLLASEILEQEISKPAII